MADKQKLRDMIDSLVDQNVDQAQVHFHSYLEDKMKETLGVVVADEEIITPDVNDLKVKSTTK